MIMKSITTQGAEKIYSYSKKAFGIFALTLLFFTSFLIINQNAEAQLSCPTAGIQQITNETAGFSVSPSINADGTRIAFSSTSNINMGNPEGNREIFLAVCFDVDARALYPYTQRVGTYSTSWYIRNIRIIGYPQKKSNCLNID